MSEMTMVAERPWESEPDRLELSTCVNAAAEEREEPEDIQWYDDTAQGGQLYGTVTVMKNGLRVKLPVDNAPRGWSGKRVEVGFTSRAIFIRRIDSRRGFRVQTIGTVRVWSARIGNEKLTNLAEAYGFPVGVKLIARWDPERGWIKAEGVIGREG